ncbi:AraC family transcriptional regulator [Rhizobium giardinii]|uniref:AraC-like DNA-binding protein n=1 Tax=Rhizobium giardinii TaxID=56731 RepID=A0A7W8UG95_9HYPH|nr:AraC family transcriptional regulator [Rhizobium giardinii]MBB5538831.1 AraC-like DNA-binding protein [Rhizobium giardinii]
MLENALLLDSKGQPIKQHHKVLSEDWDEIRAWSSVVYMPYHVSAVGKGASPASTMHSAKIGRIIVTRFAYGIPVNIGDWSPESGNAVVLTTIGGNARHRINASSSVETRPGQSFIVDCSRTDYYVDFDPDHLQLNLTIPHAVLEQTCRDWFGFVPGDALWQYKTSVGGEQSSWLALLQYAMCCIADAPDRLSNDRVGRHLEQTICIHLLNEWAARAGLDLESPSNNLAPRHVKIAEQFMMDYARQLPTMTDVAQAVQTSVRTLTNAFKQFRGYTPSSYLREQRLQGVRRDLQAGSGQVTVSQVAYAWGYINLGEFARAYRARFAELPSETYAQQTLASSVCLPEKAWQTALREVKEETDLTCYRFYSAEICEQSTKLIEIQSACCRSSSVS